MCRFSSSRSWGARRPGGGDLAVDRRGLKSCRGGNKAPSWDQRISRRARTGAGRQERGRLGHAPGVAGVYDGARRGRGLVRRKKPEPGRATCTVAGSSRPPSGWVLGDPCARHPSCLLPLRPQLTRQASIPLPNYMVNTYLEYIVLENWSVMAAKNY